jgi:HK97 family phage prohead protease
MIRLTAQLVTLDAAEGDTPSRTITGLAVPWDTVATLSGGEQVKFLKGSLPEDGPAPKLLEFHDDTRVIGVVTERVSTDEGMMFSAKLATTRAADDSLALLAMGALDSVSVGAVPTKFKRTAGGVLEVSEARWLELSVVTVPAYADAQVYSVAASADEAETIEPQQEEEPTTQDSEEENMEVQPTTVEAAVATTPIYASAKREFKLPTAAEYLAAMAAGGSEFAEYNARLNAAAGDQITSNVPGILPAPILGPTYDNLVALRPVCDAFGVRAMPQRSGTTFVRPYIDTHLSVGQQSTQLTAVSATTQVVEDKVVSKLTFAGSQTLSEQVIDWTDPNAVQIVLDDMLGQYADATDNYAADQLLAQTTQASAANVDFTDPDAVVAAIYTGAQTIAANGNVFADKLFVSLDVWRQLGSLTDSTGRPLFPVIGPMNAAGSINAANAVGNVLGLQLVADKNFAAKTCILSVCEPRTKAPYEIYEDARGIVSLNQPTILGRELAIRGYFAVTMINTGKTYKITQA